ncbi:MAG: hypothetical protein MSIBF_00445 [Candidatus Altiarchaeales archaeon IMC4]|nr:MAG: hypothetical protein MSIBF_00445 [Candidatus Altiarchaeales archaeon IMC4]
MLVFSGSKSAGLAKRVSEESRIKLGETELRKFTDGEFYIRILSGVKNENAVLINSVVDNESLVETLLLLDALRDNGAKRIDLFVPYMAYCRQDKVFKDGEALSAKTVLKLLGNFSDSITTLNAHFLDTYGRFEPWGVKLKNLDAFPLLAKHFAGRVRSPVVIAPDKGAMHYARNAAEIIGCESDYLEKTRVSDTDVRMKTKKLPVKGKDVIILDDIISTGGTMLKAAGMLRGAGAKTIDLGCVHGVFSKGTEMFGGVVDELVCTDSIERTESRVSVSGLIAGEIQK